MRHVQHLALRLFHFLQRERRLAAADDDQGRWQQIHGVLRVVEGKHLVEPVNASTFRVQITYRFGVLDRFPHLCRRDLVVVDLGAAQKARLVVGVLLEHQGIHFTLEANRGKQQAVGIVELCPIKTAVRPIGQFLDIGRAKVVALDCLPELSYCALLRGAENSAYSRTFMMCARSRHRRRDGNYKVAILSDARGARLMPGTCNSCRPDLHARRKCWFYCWRVRTSLLTSSPWPARRATSAS